MTLEATHLLAAASGFLGMLMIYKFISPRVVPLWFPAYHALPWEKQIQVNEIFMAGSHSVVVCISSWVAYFTVEELKPTTLWYDCALTRHTSAFFWGYSIADLLLMICHPHFGDVYFLMHHVVSLIAGYLGMASISIPYYVNVFLMMELTNPFVNFRFMLKALGYPEKSLLFSCTGVLIFITWWIARLGPIPIYAYHMAQLMSTGGFFKIELSMQLTSVLGYAFFTVLNLAWFRVIIKLFQREIRGLIQQGHSMAKRVQQETNSKKGG
ncbi:TLC domain-containing protein 4-like isoform X2 [Branchiostoma floridae]|uniref:TLC domain-containing protein 4-like isoform X2 n=1 Tax=Branchiostoma floridae TaxID=7739 RepID=A0A9J7HGA9_BRAFL|nr:TLC domain-containing protein 4-like isoform X2 [Branchiostoma floridae]